jgi:hypothetical protein
MNLHEIYATEDIAMGILWIILTTILAFIIKSNHADNPDYKWFIPNFFFKLVMGLFFGYTFVKILGYGGDTAAYWASIDKLVNLFFHDPSKYLDELLSTPDINNLTKNFNSSTGYPPGWIYKEPESYFVAKVISVVGLFTNGSFIALTAICSFFASLASFRLFQLVKYYRFTSDFWMAIATLFIPTVAFWCSGISKDTLILGGFYMLLFHFFALLQKDRKFTLKNIIFIVFYAYIILNIRPFMIYAIIPPLLLSFGLGYVNRIGSSIVSNFLKGGIFMATLVGFLYVLSTGDLFLEGAQETLDEVAIVQQDFASNVTYGGPRYDLNITDFTPAGMISAAPLAVFTALYRPFLTEAQGPLLLLSALEGIVLIFLTLYFIIKGPIHWRFVFNHEFLLFSLLFVLFFGFVVGFSSILFNVLVRFKAPILALFLLVLIAKDPEKAKA